MAQTDQNRSVPLSLADGYGPFQQGCGGFSLIEVVVAMTIIAAAVAAMLIFVKMGVNQRKSIAAAQGSDEIEQALQGVLIGQLQGSGCFNPPALFNSTPIGNLGTMTFATSINFNFRGTVNASARAPFDAANQRCGAPVSAAAGANHYYFCLKLSGGTGAPHVSLLSSPNAFAEVYVDLRDWRTDQQLSCNAYDAQSATSGARLYYTMYWTTDGVEGSVIKQKTSVAYVGH